VSDGQRSQAGFMRKIQCAIELLFGVGQLLSLDVDNCQLPQQKRFVST
jgi:hypothetical protein